MKSKGHSLAHEYVKQGMTTQINAALVSAVRKNSRINAFCHTMYTTYQHGSCHENHAPIFAKYDVNEKALSFHKFWS